MAEPTQRRAETRQRILAAAGDLFREHGIDGIGVDAVMKEAGLTHGGFYLHFPSKEALAAEVSQFLLEKAASRWDRISRSPDREAALEAIVETIWIPNAWRQPIAALLPRLAPTLPAVQLSAGGRARPGRHARRVDRCLPGRRRNGRWLRSPPWLVRLFLPACRRPGSVARISPGRRRQHPSGQAPRRGRNVRATGDADLKGQLIGSYVNRPRLEDGCRGLASSAISQCEPFSPV